MLPLAYWGVAVWLLHGVRCSLLDDNQIAIILELHNDYRRGEGSSNMRRLEWNHALTRQANKWANKCDWKHGFPETAGLPYKAIGQNLHATGGEMNLTASVAMWFDEKEFYDYNTNTCRGRHVCGHYTQVVWAESHLIGCAYKRCSSVKNISWRNVMYLVCNYGPGGNGRGLAGSRPPYEKGPPCSKCTTWSGECRDSLCYDCGTLGGNCTCRLTCESCGVPRNDTCHCQCPVGYGGQHCEGNCENLSERCGRLHDWTVDKCKDDYDFYYVKYECPALCGRCNNNGTRENQFCPVNRESYEVYRPKADDAWKQQGNLLSLIIILFLHLIFS